MNASWPARLLVRPFRGYAELAAADEVPSVREGVLRLLFIVGAVVAVTATGRLAPFELLVAAGSFAYIPIIQLLAVAIALRVVSRATPLRRAFGLYLAGHGPWFVTLVLIATIALVAPSPARVLFAVAPVLVVATFVWSGVLTYACFRRGLELSSRRAGFATGLHLASLTALVVSYYLAMGQLGPQILR